MDFVQFARTHGVVIDRLVSGRWVRVPTVDHPKKRNGAYCFHGDHGFVQNWAHQTEASVWRQEGDQVIRIDPAKAAADAARMQREREEAARKAADKADWIISQCEMLQHGYLAKKGFPNERGLVWQRKAEDGSVTKLLVIPMFVGGQLSTCQLINEDGAKKFLGGGRTKGAVFKFGESHAAPILCEGYATALSVLAALRALKLARPVWACFSAGNLKHMACNRPGCFVVADHDESRAGERAAQEANAPYWLSDMLGEDFNDFHQRVGGFRAAQSLRSAIFRAGKG